MDTRKVKKNSSSGLSEALTVFAKKFASLPDFVYYLIPFAVLSAWLVTLVLTDKIRFPASYYIIQFLFTYDHGIVPRGLFGEVLSWFVDIVTDDIITQSFIALDAILVVAASLCIGKALAKTKKHDDVFPIVCFLCIFSCFLPISFGEFFVDIKLDRILWFLTLFAVFCTSNKYLIWLVPALCVISTLVNPVYLLTAMLFISLVLLYKYFKSNFAVKNLLICIFSWVPMVVIGISGPWMQKNLGFENAEELVLYYFSRYEEPISQELINDFGTTFIFDYFGTIKDNIKYAFTIYFDEDFGGRASISCFFFIAIPVFAFLTWLWIKAIKAESDKFQKFIYFLCIFIPIVIIPAWVVSWEYQKYFGHAVLVEFCLILYFLTENLPCFKSVIQHCIDVLKNNPFITILMGMYVLAFT